MTWDKSQVEIICRGRAVCSMPFYLYILGKMTSSVWIFQLVERSFDTAWNDHRCLWYQTTTLVYRKTACSYGETECLLKNPSLLKCHPWNHNDFDDEEYMWGFYRRSLNLFQLLKTHPNSFCIGMIITKWSLGLKISIWV